jgi:hypothetical protein
MESTYMYFPGKIGHFLENGGIWMINHIFKLLAYIPETAMNCDDDYVNKPERSKCLGNTIDGNIFNKHNDQVKKTLVKRIFFTCMEFIQFKLLCFNLIL